MPGWSEPDAGSDLASLQTMANRDGDHYVVNGQKIWTTGAHRASHMFLLARTDPNSQRSKGLSVFHLSMDTPGIEVRPLRYMNGSHLYNEVFFNDVRIPAKDRIGPEGEGWGLTRETMNFERTSVGAFAEGKDLFKKLVEYAKTTKRNGRLLSEDPSVRRRLAQLHMDLETGHAFAYKIAWLQQEGGLFLAASSASMSKLFATELLQRIGNLGTEILGLYGQLEEGSEYAPLNGTITNIYQFCMGLTIAAGSNEIQRNIIAWVGLGLPRYK